MNHGNLSYDWPGNVRELRNAIERGMILEDSAVITSSSLPIDISRFKGHVPLGIPPNPEIPQRMDVRSKIASAAW